MAQTPAPRGGRSGRRAAAFKFKRGAARLIVAAAACAVVTQTLLAGLPAEARGGMIACNTSQNATLAVSTGAADAWTFKGAAGAQVAIEVTATGTMTFGSAASTPAAAPLTLALQRGNGQIVIKGGSALTTTLPADDQYTIVVSGGPTGLRASVAGATDSLTAASPSVVYRVVPLAGDDDDGGLAGDAAGRPGAAPSATPNPKTQGTGYPVANPANGKHVPVHPTPTSTPRAGNSNGNPNGNPGGNPGGNSNGNPNSNPNGNNGNPPPKMVDYTIRLGCQAPASGPKSNQPTPTSTPTGNAGHPPNNVTAQSNANLTMECGPTQPGQTVNAELPGPEWTHRWTYTPAKPFEVFSVNVRSQGNVPIHVIGPDGRVIAGWAGQPLKVASNVSGSFVVAIGGSTGFAPASLSAGKHAGDESPIPPGEAGPGAPGVSNAGIAYDLTVTPVGQIQPEELDTRGADRLTGTTIAAANPLPAATQPLVATSPAVAAAVAQPLPQTVPATVNQSALPALNGRQQILRDLLKPDQPVPGIVQAQQSEDIWLFQGQANQYAEVGLKPDSPLLLWVYDQNLQLQQYGNPVVLSNLPISGTYMVVVSDPRADVPAGSPVNYQIVLTNTSPALAAQPAPDADPTDTETAPATPAP